MTQLQTVLIRESDFKLQVSGYFEPGEPRTWEHPGTGDSFEINHVELVEGDLIDVLFWLDGKKNCIEYIEELCLEYINEYN
jgi:hypothetical protein